MKKQVSKLLFCTAGIALFFLLGTHEAVSQSPKTQEAARVEIAELEKTLRLLENPEEAKRLAAQLRNLLEAQKLASEQEKQQVPETESAFLDLLELYESREEQISRIGERITEFLESLTLRYRRVLTYLTQEKNRRKIASLGVGILSALAAGLFLWLLLRGITRRFEKRWDRHERRTRAQKFGRVCLATLFRVYPWIALYAVFYLFSFFFPATRGVKPFILSALLALILYLGLKHFLAFLLSPDLRPEGLIPLQDETSGYIFIWLRRILLFSLWIYLLYLAAFHLKIPRVINAAGILYKVGLTVFAIVILAQWREDIQELLSRPLRPGDPPWLSFFKRALNYFSGKVYLLALCYAGFLAVLSLAGPSHLYAYVLSSSAKSVLVLLSGAGLWILWSYLFRKLFEVTREIQERYPALAEHASRYVEYLGKAGYAAIALFSLFVLLDVWGVSVYEFIADTSWLKPLLRIPFILLFAFLFLQLAYFLINKFAIQASARMVATAAVSPVEVEKRISTLANIFKRGVAVAVAVFAGIMILSELGFDIKPILAGAGIVGLAVGFGAQNLVRDIISGLFYTFENRLRVGDVAIINGTGGLVEQVNLRTSVLRGLDGTIHVFPNGAINTLSNMTYEFSYYLFDVGVAYKEDTDRVISVLKEVGDQIMQEEAYRSAILEPLEILGVDKFGDSAVIIKARIKTLPIKQWLVGREMNRRIKKRFDELGIEIPFPHQSLYFGEASKPISVKLEGFQERREEIKAWIREILEERKESR
jgi:small-conductance mechanosensitive channel